MTGGWIRQAAARTCARRFDATASAVGEARRQAAGVVRGWDLHDVVETVELVVSELVTNAVEAVGKTIRDSGGASVGVPGAASAPHGRDEPAAGLVVLNLTVAGTSLLVEVWDPSASPPVPADQDLAAEGGRGLLLVAAFTERWSYYRPEVGGKVVWAEIGLPAPRPAGDSCAAAPVPVPRREPPPRFLVRAPDAGTHATGREKSSTV